MTIEQQDLPNGDSPRPDSASAEAKRMAARRRFLARGAAGGSGLLIVTLCHQRAFARRSGLLNDTTPPADTSTTTASKMTADGTRTTPYQPQGILVSSQLHCTSLHGSSVKTVTVYDSITHNQVTRVDCVR